MESEPAIIAACIDSSEAYKIVVRLEAHVDLSPNGMELFKHIQNYYKRDNKALAIDVEILLAAIEAKKPLAYEKLSTVIRNLPESSASNLIALLTEQRLKRLGAEMTAKLAAGDFEKAADLSAEYAEVHKMGLVCTEEADELFDVYQGVTIRELTQELREGANLTVLPDLLGDIIYDVMGGDHVCIYGQVNRGKSAVAIQAGCDYAYGGMSVLYIGNEDPAKRMLLRIMCNLCGVPLKELEEDEDSYTDEALDNGYDNIIFKELSPGSFDDVERLCEHFKPQVCIIDQARNIVPRGKPSNEAGAQELIMYQLRMLYKRLKILGVSLTQAGEKDLHGKPLENKMKLEQNDIYGSKSGVASQMDIMIGIGATKPMLESGRLYLNVCKNKASGIHDGVYAFIDPFTSSVKTGD